MLKKLITTAGLSSGIDDSLYLVSKMLGKGRGERARTFSYSAGTQEIVDGVRQAIR